MPDAYTLLQQLRELFPAVRVGSFKDASGKDRRRLITCQKVCPLIYHQHEEQVAVNSRHRPEQSELVDLHELLGTFANDFKKGEDAEDRRKMDRQQPERRAPPPQSVLKSVKLGKKLGALLLLEHLTGVLEDDLTCRIAVYNENPDVSLLKDSALNRMLNFESSKDQLSEYLFQIIAGTCIEEAAPLCLPRRRTRDAALPENQGGKDEEGQGSDDKSRQARCARKMKTTVRRRKAQVSPIKTSLSPSKRQGLFGTIEPATVPCGNQPENGPEGGGVGSVRRQLGSRACENGAGLGSEAEDPDLKQQPASPSTPPANGCNRGDHRSANQSDGGSGGAARGRVTELEEATRPESIEPPKQQLAWPSSRERDFSLRRLRVSVQRLLSMVSARVPLIQIIIIS
ncbi:hypothetical protein CBR_g7988 [Chara braunii]|uniref:Uncharacterized protein n=1 Tax=Chara braunii TaxID=69332 RepID=A0A388KKV5_CHABU|nr:hypothetical protein CBR_g7988 [Chara braunii]|eukprot:GBG70689.1 hypothetical protein CBR_g7988 [Chara braunii]